MPSTFGLLRRATPQGTTIRPRQALGVLLVAFTLLTTTTADAAPPGESGRGGGKTSKTSSGTDGGGSSFGWKLYDVSINNPVEQWIEWPFPDREGWVVNTAADVSPGPCAWDVDDRWYQIATGTVNPGDAVTVDHCRVADPTSIWQVRDGHEGWWNRLPRFMGVRLTSPSPDLTVTISYEPQGRTFTLTPVYDVAARKYVYRACVGLAYLPNDPSWPYERDEAVQPIPGSNGGWGVITHATVSVANDTGRKLDVTGKLEELAAWTSDATMTSYCSARRIAYDDWEHDYPFQYRLN